MAKKRPKGSADLSRKRTDKSLRAERAKTDESMADFRRAKEQEADRYIARSRERADARMARGRTKADRLSSEARARPAVSREAEQRAVDRRLKREREDADETLAAERRGFDAAVERQRAQVEGREQTLFAVERALTDRDLSRERSRIDQELARAARFLVKAASSGESSLGALVEREAFLAVLGRHLKQPLLDIAVDGSQLKMLAKAADVDRQTQALIDAVTRNAEEALRLLGDLLEHLARWQAESRAASRSWARIQAPRARKSRLKSGSKDQAEGQQGKAEELGGSTPLPPASRIHPAPRTVGRPASRIAPTSAV